MADAPGGLPDPGGPVEVAVVVAARPGTIFRYFTDPDRRIVFTWGYQGDGQAVPVGSSTVEITLAPVDGGTEVRLRHSGLPGGEPPAAHLAGWRHALASLAYAGSAE